MNKERFTRRSFLKLLAVSTAVAGLASCSDTGTSVTATGATRTMVDVEGTTVEVPDKPQRIVTLSEPTLDAVLALGHTPVGTVAGRGQQTVPSYLMDRAADIPLLGSVSQLNFEAIGAVQPDLILVDGTSVNNNPPIVEALREIAPTVYTGYAGGDWRKNLGFVSQALNEEGEGEKVVEKYEKRAEEMKKQLTAYHNDTFAIVRWQGNAPSLILKELPAGRALEDIGLKRPPSQDRLGRGHSWPVSAENIAEIDADYMFFGTLGGSSVTNPEAGGDADRAAAEDALRVAIQVPGFTDLTAYQKNHIIPVDGAAWTSTGGPLLMNRILDDVETNLL
ncbi:ABC transporter substrate-binding protein [Corynebacterium cystitidis]|uniref:Iron complex transport system substrate-binding protein n=1 Tax=Corynebacterium cystitidis DSM 20524 TaxID=1121357 RepID=A0A1H9UQ08_9CORY|nr:ABC transporter substrate-binding protein [Corynebacterium cystitidis]WJY81064.1 putative siderophore-binding lipoprotein YfiY precursor [Corynebacterium cystitidis DSM 20524]SES11224.1 iron complex transport system substrate-binding protein [Corynebacterium cystitidis DSM 20524]SNV90290.1 iron dicitrate-binding periplasmic protein [Corynebacterium cystitidis]